MTKQEVIDLIKDFSETFPKEALEEIKANKSDFIPELLESLDYAFHNAKDLRETGSDYNMLTYAMYMLAEFRKSGLFQNWWHYFNCRRMKSILFWATV